MLWQILTSMGTRNEFPVAVTITLRGTCDIGGNTVSLVDNEIIYNGGDAKRTSHLVELEIYERSE